MSSREKIADVFKTIGQPTITYVQRSKGKFEKALNDALNEKGQLCLVTGPSKTGKTTLYREVLTSRLETPLVVQCTRGKTCQSIWTQALEEVDFERISSRSPGTKTSGGGEVEVSGQLGWQWLAGLAGA